MATTDIETAAWARVQGALSGAKAICWDGCHKIYLLMDEGQVKEMEEHGYERGEGLVLVTDQAEALAMLKDWFACSCGLRFINAVKTVEGDPNEGYTQLIEQFELDPKEDDDS